MADNNNPADIIARAQALIDEAKGHLAAGEEFFRSQGLDPQKVYDVTAASLDLQGVQAVQKALEEDMAAVEQEAHEEMARLSFATPTSSGMKRPRMMV